MWLYDHHIGNMAAGRQVGNHCTWSVAESLLLIYKLREKSVRMDLVWGIKTSKPTTSDIVPPGKPYFLILPKQFHQLQNQNLFIWNSEDYSHLNHHRRIGERFDNHFPEWRKYDWCIIINNDNYEITTRCSLIVFFKTASITNRSDIGFP